MYLISFYVPASHLESVKLALFAEGAGQLGHYDCCCWQILGAGQFRPLPGSQPFSGEENTIAHEEEYKVEITCRKEILNKVIKALLTSHPYEVPAYAILQMIELPVTENLSSHSR